MCLCSFRSDEADRRHIEAALRSGRVTKVAINRTVQKKVQGKRKNEGEIAIKLIKALFKVYHVRSREVASQEEIKRDPFDFYPHFYQLPHDHFKRLYRVANDLFLTLIDIISLDVQRQQRLESENFQFVSPDVLLSITLRTLAGGSYVDISWPYQISRTTLYPCLHKGLSSLERGLSKIKFPVTEEECKSATETFNVVRRGKILLRASFLL